MSLCCLPVPYMFLGYNIAIIVRILFCCLYAAVSLFQYRNRLKVTGQCYCTTEAPPGGICNKFVALLKLAESSES